MSECPECRGHGGDCDDSSKDCYACGGSGRVVQAEQVHRALRAVNEVIDTALAQQQVCTLGKLIDLLEQREQGQQVIFDFCRVQPGHLISYRGYYHMLAITPNFGAFKYDHPRYNTPITVGELLAQLKAAVGATFEGYKGGVFVMSRDTWLWVDALGESTGTAVLGIEAYDYATIIRTGYRNG